MHSQQRKRSYDELFLEFSTAAEKWLLRFLTVAFALLIGFQVLLHTPLRAYFSKVDRMEGKPYRIDSAALPDRVGRRGE